MNHGIKGIVILAAILSLLCILVLGLWEPFAPSGGRRDHEQRRMV